MARTFSSEGILIAGPAHTGTSLLNRLLGRHSEIYSMPTETGFLCFGGPGERCDWPLGNPQLYINSCTDRFREQAKSVGKRLWVEKTPSHVRHFRDIFEYSVSDRVIATVRSPIETIASLTQRTNDFQYSLKEYIYDTMNILQYASNPSVFLVHLEVFQRFPGACLRNIFDFIGVAYEDVLFESSTTGLVPPFNPTTQHNEYRNWQISQSVRVTPSKWRAILTDDQAALVDKLLNATAIELGYESVLGFNNS